MRGERVDGPYPHRRRWRVRITPLAGKKRYRSFSTRRSADLFIRAFRTEQAQIPASVSIHAAIAEYEKHLKAKGNKPTSWRETPRRLRRFFPEDMPLELLTRPQCEEMYQRLRDTEYKPGKKLAADSHRNYLLEARSFVRWCEKEKGWIAENPLEDVRGTGKRKKGKPQPRLDEARKWKAKALELAGTEPGAVAALMTMMMGLRSSEITRRVVRDLDDDGRILWIEDAKTEAGNAPVEVPAELQPLLAALTKDRKPGELIFGKHWRDWPREWVQRICDLAEVPRITAHGMRGFAGTLVTLRRRGVLDDAQEVLRHEDARTTAGYVDRAARERAQRRAGWEVLDGGKKQAPHEPERSSDDCGVGTLRRV